MNGRVVRAVLLLAVIALAIILVCGHCGHEPPIDIDEYLKTVTPRCSPADTVVGVDSLTMTLREVAVGRTEKQGEALTQLQARLWHGQRAISECQGLAPEWTSPDYPWVEPRPTPGYRAEVRILIEQSFPTSAIVNAEYEGHRTHAGTRITFEGQDPLTDVIRGRHVDGDPPNIVLVRGALQSGECLLDHSLAAIWDGMPGNLARGCDGELGSVALFSSSQAMVFQPDVVWGEDKRVVDLAQLQGEVRAVPVAVWIAVENGEEDKVEHEKLKARWAKWAREDIELANAVLAANRVGIELVLLHDHPEEITGDTAVYGCVPAPHRRVVTPEDLDSNRYSHALNVYYVNDIILGSAVTCPPNQGRIEPVVFVTQRAPATSLVHEVGHALSLRLPVKSGHTHSIHGFTSANVMWGSYVDTLPYGRSHFSLGQAFRMNIDAGSWLNHAIAASGDPPEVHANGPLLRPETEVRIPCQCDPYVKGPCPHLAADVGSAGLPPYQLEPGRCPDTTESKPNGGPSKPPEDW